MRNDGLTNLARSLEHSSRAPMRQVTSSLIDLRRTWAVPVFACELKMRVRLAELSWCRRNQDRSQS
jgi:hypothetical protein